MDNTERLSQQRNMLVHVFDFPWIPFQSASPNSVYEAMGRYGSALRLTGLTLGNSIAYLLGLLLLIGNNPYIALSRDLRYFPFNVAYVFLTLLSFIVYTTAHFLCFRAVSGKGSLVAQSYLTALSSTNFALLYWLTIVILFVTRIRGIDTLIIILGSLYLLYPSFLSLRAIHRVSTLRCAVGLLMSIVISVPLFILYLYLFDFLRRARPYEFHDWRSMMIFTSMVLIAFLILVYMLLEQRIATKYPEGIPILAPFKEMLRAKWILLVVIIVIIGLITGLVTFNMLDSRYPIIKMEKHPYWITFLPAFDPDMMFVLTRDDEYGEATQLEVWQLSSNEKIDTINIRMNVARLRPSEDGLKLILSDRQSSHGNASIFDPETKKFGKAKFDYLESYGILNPYQDDIYYTPSFGGIRVERGNESRKINPNQRYFSVAVHPNNKTLFFIADSFIDVVDTGSLRIVGTIKIGGKLRDLAVSPDGRSLCITDALWDRVIIVPSPTG